MLLKECIIFEWGLRKQLKEQRRGDIFANEIWEHHANMTLHIICLEKREEKKITALMG